MQTYVKTDIPIDRQSDIHSIKAESRTGRQADKHTDIQTERKADRQTYRQIDIYSFKQTNRQTGRYIDIQRQTETQTYRQTSQINRHKGRNTNKNR